jgi:hypothetical protein
VPCGVSNSVRTLDRADLQADFDTPHIAGESGRADRVGCRNSIRVALQCEPVDRQVPLPIPGGRVGLVICVPGALPFISACRAVAQVGAVEGA